MNALQILSRQFLKLLCKLQNQGLWFTLNSLLMPQMNINIKNIFATPDKFVTVKRINIMIEIGILTPEGIKIFMQLFLR